MEIITLPECLDLNPLLSIKVVDYRSSKETSMQQIILNKNTFSFLRVGTKEVFFNHSCFSIDNSEFLLMKAGHCLMTEKLSNTENDYRSVLLFFSNELILKFIRKFELNKFNRGFDSSVYSFKYDVFIERFVESLLDISKFPTTIQVNILEVKLEEILLYLIELRGTEFIYSLVNSNDSQSQKFIKTIESNQLNILTLKELSFLCNMSISSFKRQFEKQYSESPIKWFQEKRLEHAARLMREEYKRPSDIYIDIGYKSLSSFVQAYKAKYGITPKQHHKE